MKSGNVTTERFISVLRENPELLSSDAEFLARGIADIQPSAEARNTMEQIVILLHRCREIGVWNAVSELNGKIAMDRAEDRLRKHRKEIMKKRLESPKVLEEFRFTSSRTKLFESIAECVQFISANYPLEMVEVESRRINSRIVERTFSAIFPNYLFRGESGQYPITTSSLYRLRTDVSMLIRSLEDILATKNRLKLDLSNKYKLGLIFSEGLLQHYGLPTDFLDVTASLDVAVSFATDVSIGQIGGICVFSTQQLVKSGSVIDLRGLAFAARPHRQAAFAVVSDLHNDYKHSQTISQLNLKWYWFRFTASDAHAIHPKPELLDAHTDRAAELLELLISGYGRINDDAAKWLTNRLQPAPFVLMSLPGKTENGTQKVGWISTEEAGITYDEATLRSSNYRSWSNKFTDTLIKELPEELLHKQGEPFPPIVILRIISSRGLELLPPEFLSESLGLKD